MQDLDKTIVHLIRSEKRVILPDLGAFIQKNPQDKQIIFTTFLRYNDSSLEDLLASVLPAQDPAFLLQTYVLHIKRTLATNSKYYLDNLGHFNIDQDQNITFVFDPVPTVTSDLPQINMHTSIPDVDDPVQKPSPKPSMVYADPVDVNLQRHYQPENNGMQKDTLYLILTCFSIFAFVLAYHYYWNGEEENKFNVNQNTDANTLVHSVEKHEGEIQPHFVDTSTHAVAPVNVEVTVDTAANPTVAPVTAVNIETTVETSVLNSDITHSKPIHKYHLIVGCFFSKNYADIFAEQQKIDFVDTQILTPLGNLYPVAICSVNSKTEAELYLIKYEEMTNRTAWIFRRLMR